MKSSPSSVTGFTLIELLLVVSIGGVLAVIAIPSFKALSQSQQVKNASYDLFSALSFTRSEAIKRNCDVTITPTYTSVSFPAPAHNEVGWTIDTTTSCGTATRLRTQSQLKGVAMTLNPTSTTSVTYRLTGRATATPTFLLDAYGTTTSNATCIKIELSGMPRMYKPVNGACP